MTEENALVFTFQLSKPISYHHKGNSVDGTFIEFSSPTSKNMKETAQLKQALTRAVMEAQELSEKLTSTTVEGKSSEDITGEDIMRALTISSVPLENVLEIGFKLLVSGVGKIGGEEKFNSNMANEFSVEELERCIGEYALFFVLKSFLS